jgi:hypothetical protein
MVFLFEIPDYSFVYTPNLLHACYIPRLIDTRCSELSNNIYVQLYHYRHKCGRNVFNLKVQETRKTRSLRKER